ncbi:MAG: DNA translocase FtsK 4TM domain-containing protein, partial [Desulfobulbales bacterium]
MPLPKKKESKFHKEIIALFTLFLAVFLLLCLTSYANPLLGDHPVLQEPPDNWCGTVGYYIAHYLFSFFGLTAFFPVLILIYTSVSAFIPGNNVSRLPFLVAGISGILVASSGLLATTQQLIFSPEFIRPGGYLGGMIWGLSGRVIGSAGSVLLLLLLFILSLMAAVRFSPFGAVKWFWVSGSALFKKFPKKTPP